ncbi:MAG TPA: hypothetical protein VFZ85_04125, partial [Jiangellaceae bacterium]
MPDGFVEPSLVVRIGLGHGRGDRRAARLISVPEWAGPHGDAGFGWVHGPATFVFEPVVVPTRGGQVRRGGRPTLGVADAVVLVGGAGRGPATRVHALPIA